MPLYDFFKKLAGKKDENVDIHVHLHIDKDVKIVLDGNLTIHGDGLQIQQSQAGDDPSRNATVISSIQAANFEDQKRAEEEATKAFEAEIGGDIQLPHVDFGEDVDERPDS